MARLALPHGWRIIKKATLKEDFGGVDAHYTVNHHCALQIRCRMNRPAKAADIDITWRITEPPMMRARTYAPLALFLWFKNGYAEAGKLVDVYRMVDNLEPSIFARPLHDYGSRGKFYVVGIPELFACDALLMLGGRDSWAAARLGGERDTVAILKKAAA